MINVKAIFCVLIFSGMIGFTFSCKSRNDISYVIRQHDVVVDGLADDWKGVKNVRIGDPGQLWIGQDLVRENWKGPDDLSFSWRSCYSGNRIFFLFEVTDDTLVEPALQPNSFLNDCIEIMIDTGNVGGARFTDTGQGKILHGYELHFLPAKPCHVFLNDSLAPMFPMEMAQDSLFLAEWDGEIACLKESGSYKVEIGFKVPDFAILSGRIVGLDVDVCDDDGQGRKSLLIWSGTDKEFWMNMDEYPKIKF